MNHNFPDFLCPFCGQGLPETLQYNLEDTHQCPQCGAEYMFSIAGDDIDLDLEAGLEVKMILEFDHLSKTKDSPITEIINVVFWRDAPH